MTTPDIDEAKKTQDQVNQSFLAAVYLGRPDDAAAILGQVDWSLFTPGQSPMERVLNDDLFVSRTPAEHADKNRKLVAEYAAENFDYGEHRYEDDSGWEHTDHGNGQSSDWKKTVYLKPSWVSDEEEGDDEENNSSTSATMRVVFAPTKTPWAQDGCTLVSCEVSDYSGNDYGHLPDLGQAHKSAAYGVTADQMPDFVRQVMQWCLDADRADLIAVSGAALADGVSASRAKAALTERYSNYILYRAAKLGQVDVVEAAIGLGCDPLEKVKISDGPEQSPLDFIEGLRGDSSGTLIRSVMARRAATLALDEIAESAKARPGP